MNFLNDLLNQHRKNQKWCHSFDSLLSICVTAGKEYIILFSFSFYRMKAFHIKVVRQSRAMRTKVPPASEAPVVLLVPQALR